ncbi:MAG: hypothetical protein IRY97_08670, partial [Thermomicrobiaceae bacterium]|nr:hypothetical protein [Thermomicrobiaceae bacterium]
MLDRKPAGVRFEMTIVAMCPPPFVSVLPSSQVMKIAESVLCQVGVS